MDELLLHKRSTSALKHTIIAERGQIDWVSDDGRMVQSTRLPKVMRRMGVTVFKCRGTHHVFCPPRASCWSSAKAHLPRHSHRHRVGSLLLCIEPAESLCPVRGLWATPHCGGQHHPH